MWHFLSSLSQPLLWHMEPPLWHMACETLCPSLLSLLSFLLPFTFPLFSTILLCSFQLHHLPLTCMWCHLSSHHIFSRVFPTSLSLLSPLLSYQLSNCIPMLSLFSLSPHIPSMTCSCCTLFSLYIVIPPIFSSPRTYEATSSLLFLSLLYPLQP